MFEKLQRAFWKALTPDLIAETVVAPTQSLLSAEPSEDERLAADESSMEQFEDHGPAVTEPQAGPSRKGTEKRKRTRTAQACEPCRKRKAKVSSQSP